ncbi:Conserved_hypothetical protein [Hexamita inflata]|uniref:Uncharacterized protein n=1 Tax=Hexamita inflata TaxID=28002 RepID=A0AA86UQ11_9EUKA|nr:Conserved hypothetical protein [Hexamita inflata]
MQPISFSPSLRPISGNNKSFRSIIPQQEIKQPEKHKHNTLSPIESPKVQESSKTPTVKLLNPGQSTSYKHFPSNEQLSPTFKTEISPQSRKQLQQLKLKEMMKSYTTKRELPNAELEIQKYLDIKPVQNTPKPLIVEQAKLVESPQSSTENISESFAQIQKLKHTVVEIQLKLAESKKSTYTYKCVNYLEFITQFTNPQVPNKLAIQFPQTQADIKTFLENEVYLTDSFSNGLLQIIENQKQFKNPRINELQIIREAEQEYKRIIQTIDDCKYFTQAMRLFEIIRCELELNLLDTEWLKRSLEVMINKCLVKSVAKMNELINQFNELQDAGYHENKCEKILEEIEFEKLFQETAVSQTECEVIFQMYDDYQNENEAM